MIANIRNKTKGFMIDTNRMIRGSYKQLNTNKCDNLKRKWANTSKNNKLSQLTNTK